MSYGADFGGMFRQSVCRYPPCALAVLRLSTGRHLHRQVGGLLALQDAIDVAGRPPVLLDIVRPIGDEAAAATKKLS
jgi:hypothetical protein